MKMCQVCREQFQEFGHQQLWKAERGNRTVPSQQQFRFQKWPFSGPQPVAEVKIMWYVAGGWWILPDEVVRIYKKKYVMKHKTEYDMKSFKDFYVWCVFKG